MLDIDPVLFMDAPFHCICAWSVQNSSWDETNNNSHKIIKIKWETFNFSKFMEQVNALLSLTRNYLN